MFCGLVAVAALGPGRLHGQLALWYLCGKVCAKCENSLVRGLAAVGVLLSDGGCSAWRRQVAWTGSSMVPVWEGSYGENNSVRGLAAVGVLRSDEGCSSGRRQAVSWMEHQ